MRNQQSDKLTKLFHLI